MRGRRHDSIALPGGRRVHDPDSPGTRVAAASQADTGGSMADNLKQTGKPDDQRINLEQDHEVSYWAKELGVSPNELRQAVQRAGPMVKDVQQHLNR
jgi:hypothetical protein